MSHWAIDLIGKQWKLGEAGPDVFDCWGFVRYVQKHQFGIEVSDVVVDNLKTAVHELSKNAERENWVRVWTPMEGDLVMMARNKLPVHIGVWVAANGTTGVLHCVEGSGVLYNPARSLALVGWGGLQYYRHKSKCTS